MTKRGLGSVLADRVQDGLVSVHPAPESPLRLHRGAQLGEWHELLPRCERSPARLKLPQLGHHAAHVAEVGLRVGQLGIDRDDQGEELLQARVHHGGGVAAQEGGTTDRAAVCRQEDVHAGAAAWHELRCGGVLADVSRSLCGAKGSNRSHLGHAGSRHSSW